jgi:hypothetical protein
VWEAGEAEGDGSVKRRVGLILLLLVAGAIVNVGVAWGICYRNANDGPLDCMLEGPSDEPESYTSSRYGYAGVCARRRGSHSRFSISILGGYSGGWRDVPNLDSEIPGWADWFLSDAALAELQSGNSRRQRYVEAAGWPCLGISGSFLIEWEASSQTSTVVQRDWGILSPPRPGRWMNNAGLSRLLPLRPIWPGFAINTLFYSGVLWGGWLLLAAPFALRRRRRIKRGLCPACAYPVGGSDVCTECGKPVIGNALSNR